MKHLSNRMAFLRMRKNDTDVRIVFGDKLFHISTCIVFDMLLVEIEIRPRDSIYHRRNESQRINDIHSSLFKNFAAVFDL